MSDEQPQAKPSAKPRYTLDDAGILSRTVGTETTAIAAFKEEDGSVCILDRVWEPVGLRALERMGKKIGTVSYAPAPVEKPADAVPIVEPPTEPHLGERTPAWLAWCRQADPQRFADVCVRLKLSDATMWLTESRAAEPPPNGPIRALPKNRADDDTFGIRAIAGALDKREVQTTSNLQAYNGKFYIGVDGADWCDTATESYRRSGPDSWQKYKTE